MKQKIFLIIAFLALFGQTFYAQTENTDSYNTVSVSIKFYDKTMYYPYSTDTNPVFIHISIKNNGTDTLRFKLADDRMFSVDFNAYTIKNTQLEQTESLIRKRTTNQTVYFREIVKFHLNPERNIHSLKTSRIILISVNHQFIILNSVSTLSYINQKILKLHLIVSLLKYALLHQLLHLQ